MLQRAWPLVALLGALALMPAILDKSNVRADPALETPAPVVEAPPPPSCDRPQTIQVATSELEFDVRDAIDRTHHFLTRCGEDEEIRTLKLRAHSRLGETYEARLEADRLVKLAPENAEYRITQGELDEKLGLDDDAVTAYREAYRLSPKSIAASRLSSVYARHGRVWNAPPPKTGKRAAKAIAVPPAEAAPMMPVNLTPGGDWDGTESTASLRSADGKATIAFTPGQVAHTNVLLNGQLRVRMIVDTGATIMGITKSTAAKLGIDVTRLKTGQIGTAGGVRTIWLTTLAEVRVGNIVARNVPCGISEDRDLGDEALLGQSFLSRFKTTVDAQHGVIEIAAR